MKKFKFLKKENITKLPKNPGVYVFRDGKRSTRLYIGKASNIRKRVKNHFQQPSFRDNLFINQVMRIGFLKTDSEIEALILEANLIKKYRPKYNIVWRDDKNYFFIGITEENYPRVFITHQPKPQNTKYKILRTKFVGPFVDGSSLKRTLKILRKIFLYRSCKVFPKRPCLWYQLKRCPAPCLVKSELAQEINFKVKVKKECQRNVKNLLNLLTGKKKEVLKNLKKEMKKTSKLEDFEAAARIRDQVFALEKILENAKIFGPGEITSTSNLYEDWKKTKKVLKRILKTEEKISRIEAYDVSNIQGKMATGSMITFINGVADKNFYRKFKIKITGKPNDIAMIKEILERRFKHPEWGLPDIILIDGGVTQFNVALKTKEQAARNNQQKKKIRNIKVISLAKKENKLFIEFQKKPILLKTLPREIFNLILQLRDEAHRFAITYHKKLRKKKLLN